MFDDSKHTVFLLRSKCIPGVHTFVGIPYLVIIFKGSNSKKKKSSDIDIDTIF